MTLQTTANMIYIGTQPIMDLNETDGRYENAAAIAGTYEALEMVTITSFDVTEDGVVWSDEIGSGDYIEYTIGGVTYSGPQDAIVLYDAVITERDGTLHNVEISVIQAPNGDTFVNDQGNRGFTDNLNIRTIELVAPTSVGSAGRNTFASTDGTVVCFGADTTILTDQGDVAITSLRKGDRVALWGGGFEPICWIGVRHVPAAQDAAPVIIPRNALGPGHPQNALTLTAQHRVYVRSSIVQRMFDVGDVFVAAKNMVGAMGVYLDEIVMPRQFYHILCARHCILIANGTPVESLFPGQMARQVLPQAALSEVARLAAKTPDVFARPCRLVPTGPQQRRLMARHVKNSKPCITSRRGDVPALPLDPRIGAFTAQNAPEAARLIQ